MTGDAKLTLGARDALRLPAGRDLTITVTMSPLFRGIVLARCRIGALLIKAGCRLAGVGYEEKVES